MARMILTLAVSGAAFAAHAAYAQNSMTSDARVIQIAPPAASNPATGNAATGSLPPPPPAVDKASESQVPGIQVPGIQVPERPIADGVPPLGAPQQGIAAESKPPEKGEGRFTFSRLSDGYVRLDNRTGEIAICKERSAGWTCQVASEDRGVLENEIARLQGENAALKEQLLAKAQQQAKELPPPEVRKDEPPAPGNERPVAPPPGDPNIDRAKAMVEKAWRQLVDMITTLQKEILKKS